MRYKKVEKNRSRQDAKAKNGQRHVRRRRRNYTLFYVLLALFAAGTGVYLSLTMFFNVEEINVDGSSRYSEVELAEAAGIKKGDNLFKIDPARAEEKLLAKFSYIDELEVRRQFPTRILIVVTEAEPFAALEEADGYTLVSSRGRVLERALEAPPEGLMEVRGISTVLSTEEDEHRLAVLNELIAYMDEHDMTDYNFIDLSDTLDIVMICQNRLRVELGSELELDYKLRFVDEVVQNKIASTGFMLIDASTPGEVMTKTLTISPWDTIDSQSPQTVTDDEEE